jgi:hypothetical protein
MSELYADETATGTGEGISFKDTLAGIPRYIDDRLPSMDKKLDTYFDSNIPAVIDEWGLVTSVHLSDLERRLERVTTQINHLEKGRKVLETRAESLDREISKLEKK